MTQTIHHEYLSVTLDVASTCASACELKKKKINNNTIKMLFLKNIYLI